MNRIVVALGASSLVIALLFAWAHWPHRDLPESARADRLLLDKSERRLVLLRGGEEVASYRVALGDDPSGAKRADGDGRTPEGSYIIDFRPPQSTFSTALHISYPSPADWRRATTEGVDPGGPIFIHGLPKRFLLLGRMHRFFSWTDGSIGLTNAEMRDVYRAVPDGTPIELRP